MTDKSFDMSPEERAEIVREFLSEAQEHLSVLNEKLLLAENAIKAQIELSNDDLNAMFRAAHTIKGTASFIGLTRVVKLTHEMETILQQVKTREIPLTAGIIDVLFEGFDVLEALCKSLKESGEEKGDIEDSVRKIHAILNSAPNRDGAPFPSDPPPENAAEHNPPAESEINEKYLVQYIIETESNLDSFSERLLTIEKGNVEDSGIINELFRFTHTIKGSSGVINARDIMNVAHSMENILSLYREQKEMPDSAIVSLLFKGVDAIRDLLSCLKKRRPADISVAGVLKELEECYRRLTAGKTADIKVGLNQILAGEALVKFDDLSVGQKNLVAQAVAEDKAVFKILFTLEKHVPLKSMKVLLIQEKLRKEGVVVAVNPSVEEVERYEVTEVMIGIIYCTLHNEKEIRFILAVDGLNLVAIERTDINDVKDLVMTEKIVAAAASQPARAETEKGKKAPVPMEAGAETPNAKSATMEISTIRIDCNKLDNLMNLSGELVIVRAQFTRMVGLLGENIRQQKELGNLVEKVKVDFEDFSKNMRGCLVSVQDRGVDGAKVKRMMEELNAGIFSLEEKITKSNLMNRIHSLDETTRSLGKISSDIQSGVMQTRMIAIEGVFTRFKRIVRDIAKDLGKAVNLVITGEETELDKKIVDTLGDPLTHMIRNAIDHGIEDRKTRRNVGKAETGNIFLAASHRGNNICIEISDDGRGLDSGKIAKKGVEKGFITQDRANAMTEKEKLSLIFLPGFSTAEQVTGLSGRGVGMDVVKNIIASVDGVIDIQTELGKGTTFLLKIPLTLAIIQALLVIVGDEVYAIPIEGVTEIVKVPVDDIYSIDGNPTVKIRGHALSLVELESVIRIKGKNRDGVKDKRMVIITDGESHLGVVVDALIGEDEIVIKSLSDHFASVVGITGASILGDGRVALILDPAAIIRESK